ncbi:MAG TPA: trypsin-like peptidase domain-containing protein [Candidatus Limnocylindrales bacterium]|nr:trypsin-like peptidase domain-containing protein [Candidatus Limnocylindrales bacterium]
MPRIPLFRSLLLASFLLCFVASSSADTLKITSTPPGATVELDGITLGATPFEKDFPGGYFHRTHTTLGQRLEHPMIARLSLPGYATREINLTVGPMNWIDLHGHNHGEYWLIKSDHFHADLELISAAFTGTVAAVSSAQPATFQLDLSLEEIVKRAKPAVVCLKGLNTMGSGFFVTATGVIATNAHVARGDSTLLALLPDNVQLQARVVYIDADLDIALVKADPPSPNYAFPYLVLADISAVQQGESVLAVGNPGDAMLFSATKGIVSAVGKFPSFGPGTWIQTDAPINPGNSGGPLLNSRGQVVGLNTLKITKKNVTGIGFALSSTDLLTVLHRFYPDISGATVRASSDAPADSAEPAAAATQLAESSTPPASSPVSYAPPDGYGQLTITSEPDAAEIFVDGKFHGNAPATLKLPAGSHAILLKSPGRPDFSRTLELPKSSKLNLKALFDPSPTP